jgi:hypothetical protein
LFFPADNLMRRRSESFNVVSPQVSALQGLDFSAARIPTTGVAGYDMSSLRDSPKMGKFDIQAAIIHSQRDRTDLNAVCDYLAAFP